MLIENIKANETIKPNSNEIEKLKMTFPQFFNKDGEFLLEHFKDMLKTGEITLNKEGYELNFLGKSYARYLSSTKTETFIVPHVAENEKVENKDSDNLYIIGDNLDALKHLLGSYAGKIKCIYIDPPYNTGSDGFVYPDNFSFDAKKLAETIGIEQEEAERIINLKGKSSHSAWLTFMYPRLILARELLSDEGAIIISISKIEHSNLKLMCDEIFNEANFIEDFIWVNEGNTDNQDEIISNHEYVIAYAKNKETLLINKVVDPNISKDSKANRDFVENSMIKNGSKNPPSFVNLPAGFPCEIDDLMIEPTNNLQQVLDEINEAGYINRPITDKYKLHFPLHKEPMFVSSGKLVNEISVFSGWANNKKLESFIKNDCKPIEENGETHEFFIKNTGAIYYRKEGRKPQRILTTLHNMGSTEKEKNRLEKMGLSFDYPKPIKFISYLCSIFAKDDDIILDFFSGSGTTAEAVFVNNFSLNTKTKFIMVQLPEQIAESNASYQLGFSTIDEIGRERIKRAAEKIREETGADIDYGFKTYSLETIKEEVLTNLDVFDDNPRFIIDDMVGLFDTKVAKGKESIISTYLALDGYGLSKESDAYKLDKYTANKIEKSLYIIENGLQSSDIMVLIRQIESMELDITRVVIYTHSLGYQLLHELRTNLKNLRNNKSVELIERY